MTRRLNQDLLENFFGSIRQQWGNSDNPTPLQFTRAFRKLFHDYSLVLSSGNCTEDLDAILLRLGLTSRKHQSHLHGMSQKDQPQLLWKLMSPTTNPAWKVTSSGWMQQHMSQAICWRSAFWSIPVIYMSECIDQARAKRTTAPNCYVYSRHMKKQKRNILVDLFRHQIHF